MAQRSRKRGRHGPPAARPAPPVDWQEEVRSEAGVRLEPQVREQVRSEQSPPPHLPQPSRSEARNAEVRATLRPYEPGERPAVILLAVAVAAAMALANLIAWLAGGKIGGARPNPAEVIVFAGVMSVCAFGMWRMWYGAVLGFMALMAIIAVLFSLFLVEASNWLGVVVALAFIVVSGYLFFKLVRVLSRLQTPRDSR